MLCATKRRGRGEGPRCPRLARHHRHDLPLAVGGPTEQSSYRSAARVGLPHARQPRGGAARRPSRALPRKGLVMTARIVVVHVRAGCSRQCSRPPAMPPRVGGARSQIVAQFLANERPSWYLAPWTR